ncbi:MAG: aspartate aminotransferase family protein, partial [Metallosphaera sp.]
DRVENAADARKAKRELYVRAHEKLLKSGVFIPPSQFEALFTSSEHNDDIVNESISKFKSVLEDLV